MPRSTTSTSSVQTGTNTGSFYDPEDPSRTPVPAVDSTPDSLTRFGIQLADEYISRIPLHLPSPSSCRPSPHSQHTTTTSTSTTPKQAILVSTSITTGHVKQLHELLQSKEFFRARLKPAWDIQGSQVEGFTATMRFEDRVTGETVEEILSEVRCGSKKEAKEKAAGLGLEWVGRLGRDVLERTKAEEGGTANGAGRAGGMEEDKEDWVSMVHLLCQSCGGRPEWKHYAVPNGAGFYCELRLPESLPIPDIAEKVFGGPEQLSPKKKTAQKATAKVAILHIKSLTSSATPLFTGKTPGPKSKLPPRGTIIKLNKQDSIFKKLNDACQQMGIKHEYKLDAGPGTGIWDVKLLLCREGVRTGFVRRYAVYGKEKAKTMVAEEALTFVKGKEAERLGVMVVEVMEEQGQKGERGC